jgi:probable selenium-dependent hydroxylase accessory protein YqeC
LKQLSLKHSAAITEPALVSFIGAGGKTTLVLRLAEELSAAGHKVIVTTSTRIYPPDKLPLILASTFDQALAELQGKLNTQHPVVIGSEISPDGKLKGLEPDIVNRLFKELQIFTLVEADGARGKSLKGFSDYEPLIPSASAFVFAVIGADVLDQTVDESQVHRSAQFCAATGIDAGAAIKTTVLAKSYRQMHGIAIRQAPSAAVIAILNKTDLLVAPGKIALDLRDALVEETGSYEALLLTTAQDKNPVKFIMQTAPKTPAVSVAAVVLAAGLSKRMGEDKLNLKIGGSTVFETTLKAITKAGFQQLIVVTRPGSNITGLARNYNCHLVENKNPELGQSSSLKVGLNALESSIQGALFALADQPLITPELYNRLMNSYRKKLKLVTCPLYRGKRGNPTIFDRRTWPDLQLIEGDQGGRSLLRNLAEDQVDIVTVDDPAVVTDLDTPADYASLLDRGK